MVRPELLNERHVSSSAGEDGLWQIFRRILSFRFGVMDGVVPSKASESLRALNPVRIDAWNPARHTLKAFELGRALGGFFPKTGGKPGFGTHPGMEEWSCRASSSSPIV
jgi:hypothetical protein